MFPMVNHCRLHDARFYREQGSGRQRGNTGCRYNELGPTEPSVLPSQPTGGRSLSLPLVLAEGESSQPTNEPMSTSNELNPIIAVKKLNPSTSLGSGRKSPFNSFLSRVSGRTLNTGSKAHLSESDPDTQFEMQSLL